MDNTIENNICELICLAYGDQFEKLPSDAKNRVRTYASSIIAYLKGAL